MLAATWVKMRNSGRKVNTKKYNISSTKCVTRKLLEVSRCSRAKQRPRNVQKSVLKRCRVDFLLIRPFVVFSPFSLSLIRRLALHYFTLVIVDTTAAPLCILSVSSILTRCVAPWNIPIHNKDFQFTHIPYNRWDNTGNARFDAQFQLDLHCFDQNILSFENSLF